MYLNPLQYNIFHPLVSCDHLLSNLCVSPTQVGKSKEGYPSLATCIWESPLICPLPITKVFAVMSGVRGKIGLKLLFDLFMNAKGDYWWKLLSLGISYVWFDHLDALQIKKANLIAWNDTPQGDWILQHIFPFRMLHKKLLHCVRLQSTCTWSKHHDIYPLLTL